MNWGLIGRQPAKGYLVGPRINSNDKIIFPCAAHSTFWTKKMPYPEQQLPGVPHELGVPQQPPEPGSVRPCDGAMTVL
jgi:hypothetical protein